jgi:hypothetical protein
VADAVVSDSLDNIVLTATHKLPFIDVLQGEAFVALLTNRLAVSYGCVNFLLERDALLVILVVNNFFFFFFPLAWPFVSNVSNISLELSSF